jgi:hypothetical protein
VIRSVASGSEWASLAGLRREGLSVLLVEQKARKALPFVDRV